MSNLSSTSALQDATAVTDAVSERGLLFLSDPKRPNAIQVVTGQFPRGSWWSHPQANDIYAILTSVERHPDVLLAKLLSGKVTLIHRALWPALLRIVTAREPWQTQGLSPLADRWLTAFDEAEAAGAAVPPVSRTISKEIEARLLVFAESVHTSTGKHETEAGILAHVGHANGSGEPGPPTIDEAKRAIETAAAGLGTPPPKLPWASPAPT